LHIWASASRSIPSAFRVRQLSPVQENSGTGLGPYIAVLYRTGFGIGTNFLSVNGLTGGRIIRQSVIKKLKEGKKEYKSAQVERIHSARLHCRRWRGYTLHTTVQAMEMNAPCTPHSCWCRWIRLPCPHCCLCRWIRPQCPNCCWCRWIRSLEPLRPTPE
jgi:hypothetical protein